MAFVPISTLFIVARSTWNALKLANDEAALDDELEKYRDPEFFFENLSDPYLKLEAKNKLLLAEYQVEREKLLRAGSPEEVGLLWRRLTKRMDTNLRSTAEELKMQPANLYQIAVLSTGLAKVVGETENELAKLSHRIDETSKRITESERELRFYLSSYESRLATWQEEVHKLTDALGTLKRDFTARLDSELEGAERKMESRCDNLRKVVDLEIERVRADLRRLQGELAGAGEAIVELQKTVSLQVQSTQELIANLKDSFACELSVLRADLEQGLREQTLLLQHLGDKIAGFKTWFWIAVGAAVAWLSLLTVAAVLF
jgi:predicted  nucleic acid-binding Zn-ribbon protein